jgi:hypothetical protein
MYQLRRIHLTTISLLFVWAGTNAQQNITIPAATGYSSNEVAGRTAVSFNNDGSLVTAGNDTLHYFFYFRNKGEANLKLLLDAPSSDITVSFSNQKHTKQIRFPVKMTPIELNRIVIEDTGFYELSIYLAVKDERQISGPNPKFVLHQVSIYGTATKDLQVNKDARRNAASVHLSYPVATTENITGFYNEITVPAGYDPVHSYYMACGFSRGYFGIQVNSAQERRVIFSVWDAGKETEKRNKVADSNRVQLIAKGDNVVTSDFENEGTGGHSHWVYNWKAGETYRFYVAALPDSATQSTSYTAYFFMPEVQQWKLIACFRAPKDNNYLKGLYSFSENFDGVNGHLQRKAFFGNQWVSNDKREWKELVNARFTCDATGRKGDRIDMGAGTNGKFFYLWNGGFIPPEKKPGDTLLRLAGGEKPKIDLSKNADSLQQAKKDALLIEDYCKTSGMGACSYKDGIYYFIIEPGSRFKARLTDTLKVYYRGNLLDGTVFDKTGEEPASFPLNRLIKGWQTGLQLIGEGGRMQLMVPAAQAYGLRNLGIIPPNSVLIFDIEIVAIRQ